LSAAHEEARRAVQQSARWRDELAKLAERRALLADPAAAAARQERLAASAAAAEAGSKARSELELLTAGFQTKAQLRARSQEALSAFDGSLQELADLEAAQSEQIRHRAAAEIALEAA